MRETVRRTAAWISIVVLLSLLSAALLTGCGKAREGSSKTEETSVSAQDRYREGYAEGYRRGRERGYEDGKEGLFSPDPRPESGWDANYAAGYQDGFSKGYREGYREGEQEAGGGEAELAEVEAAMIAFAQANAPGLQFRVENIVIHGNEAAGIAVCTTETHERALVVVKKGASGWYGVDFGTGIEPPSWYKY